MKKTALDLLRYPVGKFSFLSKTVKKDISKSLEIIFDFPKEIETQVAYLNEDQLNTPYRLNGWTIRQVIHHCADSHMNGYIRFKLTITEDKPIIKTYNEKLWAELIDSESSIDSSLLILKGMHKKWYDLMKSFTDKEWSLYYIHPEENRNITLKEALFLYSWHCKHHLAHIKSLKNRKVWK